VTVVSALHRDGVLDPDVLAGATDVRPTQAYANAQLTLVLFTRALALSAEQRVTAVAVHPGYIDTGSLTAVYGGGGLPIADGAAHILHAADTAVEVVNGGYYEGLLAAEPAPIAGNPTAAEQLWRATARLRGWDYTAARTLESSSAIASPAA
jgi:NAD(P)-dependent dehydrogenase (short-subunit alcohol dehydrogenase family)